MNTKNIKMLSINNTKIVGEVLDTKKSVIMIKNPVEIYYEDNEMGSMMFMDSPIKESQTELMYVQVSSVDFTTDISYEILMYYTAVLKKLAKQKETTKEVLVQMTDIINEKLLQESIEDQIISGKIVQRHNNTIN
jgi:hypothetical protein